ncbi:acetylxylan esterase [Elsinoe australis]|uniref:Acetylxylan esterase n=1 Tax=Elsinoe australis TaxID=40998 RepID=A0A4U7B3C0_9PEZI|nr:acetylxylan esterase [Elsinoe australis]
MMIVNNVGAAALALAGLAAASPVELQERQSCPKIHVFGARETTAPAGYGTAGVVVNLVLNAYPGSTAEAINYPACGGQASCGGATYAQSALAGTSAIASAINSFNQKCPSTQLVIVGYSQGGQISDNAFCGGGDTNIGLTSTAVPISASALNQIKAAIFMGDPRYIAGLPYNVGTCTQQGFAPRPAGFKCPAAQAAKIKSYCDSADPYCCKGSDQATHQGYGTKYGQQALAFIKTKLTA